MGRSHKLQRRASVKIQRGKGKWQTRLRNQKQFIMCGAQGDVEKKSGGLSVGPNCERETIQGMTTMRIMQHLYGNPSGCKSLNMEQT